MDDEEKILKEIMNLQQDEELDQMVQKVNKTINKYLDYFLTAEVSEYILQDTEALKNLIIVRKMLKQEKTNFEVLNKMKNALEEI